MWQLSSISFAVDSLLSLLTCFIISLIYSTTRQRFTSLSARDYFSSRARRKRSQSLSRRVPHNGTWCGARNVDSQNDYKSSKLISSLRAACMIFWKANRQTLGFLQQNKTFNSSIFQLSPAARTTKAASRHHYCTKCRLKQTVPEEGKF